MSFLRPDVNDTFQKLQSFFLWFQMAYAVWQFMRTAKFFRLPYVMVSSLWHDLDSALKSRKLIMMRDDIDIDKDFSSSEILSLPAGMTIDEIYDSNVQISFDAKDPYIYLTTKRRAAHMKIIRVMYLYLKNDPKLPMKFGRDDDLLWPKVHLIRRLSFDEAMMRVLKGKGYITEKKTKCFFDYTTKENLNQNFVRFASIWPLILQARNYDFWSVILSIVIILMDLLSYFANMAWTLIQNGVSRLAKHIISLILDREWRTFSFTFMATISRQFECKNFVTDEASSKEVNKLLLATHMRLDKRKISKLQPICGMAVPERRGQGAGTAQRIPITIHNVDYSVLVQGQPLSDGKGSSVLFQNQDNIKREDWTMADMAYFLQVCDYCQTLKFPPIKHLDGNTALCCTFEEILDGVQSRSFVVCEFSTSQTLFIT